MKVHDTALLNSRTASPLHLTRLGFGGAPLGNLFRNVEEDEAQATLQAAWDAGLRYFDTAPQYGLGTSEIRFSKALPPGWGQGQEQ
jgi:D-threo-aldose 1-dehydrogenase